MASDPPRGKTDLRLILNHLPEKKFDLPLTFRVN